MTWFGDPAGGCVSSWPRGQDARMRRRKWTPHGETCYVLPCTSGCRPLTPPNLGSFVAVSHMNNVNRARLCVHSPPHLFPPLSSR